MSLLREVLEKGKLQIHPDISNNGIKSLTELKFPDFMQKLDASYNKLTDLQGCPKTVLELNVSHNELTSLDGARENAADLDISVNPGLKNLKGLPKYLGGRLDAHGCGLTSLEGSPEMTASAYTVGDNQLTSLKHGPYEVGVEYGGVFIASFNPLTSLEGAPMIVHGDVRLEGLPKIKALKGIGRDYFKAISGKLHIDFERIESHALGLLLIKHFEGINLDGMRHEAFEIINKWVKQAKGDNAEEFIIDCQHELIEAGFEELAQL